GGSGRAGAAGAHSSGHAADAGPMTARARAPRHRARVGISGYVYDGWRGKFYPEALARRRWLEFASRRFPTIELNGTFYSLKSRATFAKWAAEVPDGFVFSVK